MLGLALALIAASLATPPPATVDTVLDWLPADTETVIAAERPFVVPQVEVLDSNAVGVAQGFTLGLLTAAEKGRVLHTTQGLRIRFSLLAGRKFGWRNDDKDGLVSYQGCAAYAFEKPLPSALIARSAEETVLGHPTWVSKGSQNESEYQYTYRVAQPRPDLLLICNDRDFFTEILARMAAKPNRQALPETLPEWKHVDRLAPLWGVRHFDAHPAKRDDTNPANFEEGKGDKEALGIAMQAGHPGGTVWGRWMTKSKSNPWPDLLTEADFNGQAQITRKQDGAWELACPAADQHAASFTAFVLLGMLGFSVSR